MRKLILSLVFVFATGTMMNAGTLTKANTTVLEEVYPGGCVQFAFDLENYVGEMDYDTFSGAVSWCESW